MNDIAPTVSNGFERLIAAGRMTPVGVPRARSAAVRTADRSTASAQASVVSPTETSERPAQTVASVSVTSPTSAASSLQLRALRIPARRDVGQLRLDDGEHMTLHTRDALSLFAGRAAVKGSAAQAIVGGRRFAAAMRSLWLLSGDDNPYADWMLLRADAALQGVHEHLARTGTTLEAELTRLRQRGLSCQVLASARPVSVSLGFASPYGFATAEAIVEFDHHVRLVRTLVMRNRMSDAQGRQAVRDAGRRLRALFLEPIRWERTLLRDDLRPLSRADFVPGADAAAAQRVMTVQDELGLLPRDVLSGDRAPRHSRRPLRAGAPRGTAGPAAAGRPEPRGIGLFPTIDPVWTEVGGYAAAATTESDVDPFDPFLGAEPRDLI